MRPVETIPGMGRGGIKENGGKGEFKYDISVYYIPSTTIKIRFLDSGIVFSSSNYFFYFYV
jgi:hypothetical protein